MTSFSFRAFRFATRYLGNCRGLYYRVDEGVFPYNGGDGFRHPRRGRCPHRPVPPAPIDHQASGSEKRSNSMRRPPPTTWALSATGRQRQESQKSIACPTARQNRRLHRYADPRRARRATVPERAQAPFSLPPGAAYSLFGQGQKENGGRIPRGNGPLREQNPPWPTSGGPSSPKAGGLLRSASPRPAPADISSIL